VNCGVQRRSSISRTRFRAAHAALALSMFLVRVFLAPQAAQAQAYTETILHSFQGSPDGYNPYSSLVRDKAGNLYGTTAGGGTSMQGTVFKVDTSGTETVLYSFKGSPDASGPYAGLVRDGAGNLYGTTPKGGRFDRGTVFKVDTAGKETVLHNFRWVDGKWPYGGLVRDNQGNLYGTTSAGGTLGRGTVFKLDVSGKETVVCNFTGQGGRSPWAGVIRDAVGNLYGTTLGYGGGTVFEVEAAGGEIVLHRFGSKAKAPYAALTRDASGKLYGTSGGGKYNQGAVFNLDMNGAFGLLYSFTGSGGDGSDPQSALVRDAAGTLYGTTVFGGASGLGTVFRVTRGGKETVLHSFTGSGGDGANPYAGLIMDSAGNLYGTTQQGGIGCGTLGCGVVFELSPH
jgi:uncharacterized repeat protein (TIGR03803 family)